jgi:hypothetical protein
MFRRAEELLKIYGQRRRFGEHAGQYLEIQVLDILVAEASGLNFSYPAIHPLDETERNTVLRLAP